MSDKGLIEPLYTDSKNTENPGEKWIIIGRVMFKRS